MFKTGLGSYARGLKEFCIHSIGNLKQQRLANPKANFKFWLATVKDILDAVYEKFVAMEAETEAIIQ